MANLFISFLPLLALVYIGHPTSACVITPGFKLYPQNTSLLSPSGIFAFGFYKKADGFGLGIWLTGGSPNETVFTWTANRDDPPIPSEAYLEFSKAGKLLIWTKQSVIPFAGNLTQLATSASFLDSGNFVIYNGTDAVWESFNYPTDTILTGQSLYLGDSLVSSVSNSDRSSGKFTLILDNYGNLAACPLHTDYPSFEAYWASANKGIYGQELALSDSGRLYLIFESVEYTIAQSSSPGRNKTTVFRATLDPDGNFRLYLHIFLSNGNSTMMTRWSALRDQCEIRGYCGSNSYCSSNASTDDYCLCFPGFSYVDPNNKLIGCYRTFTYGRFCGINESSMPYSISRIDHMKIDYYPYAEIPSIESECADSCMNDCNCWAALYADGRCKKYTPPILYAVLNSGLSGTAFIKQSHNISLPADQGPLSSKIKVSGKKKRKIVLILAPSLGFLAILFTLLAAFGFLIYRRKTIKYHKLLEMENLGQSKEFTLQSFSYRELEKATDGFKEEVCSTSCGKIYEGIISEGSRKVAVKRLEKVEDEGEREFMAEMKAMGRIHHKNVVQLLGFCLQGATKLLVYQFLRNSSLADILYDVERRPSWKQRKGIALDVARGIRYLHEECDTLIIHCNIEPKNILVDENWTAKISNFESAKLQMPYQTANLANETKRKRYLPPERQSSDTVSKKVDVYDYGLLLLEIICCSSNMEINVLNGDEAFYTWVYKCFMAKKLRELIGDEEVDMNSLERLVKVGLICSQNDPNLRPTMKDVVLMLEGIMEIPIPHSPVNCVLGDS